MFSGAKCVPTWWFLKLKMVLTSGVFFVKLVLVAGAKFGGTKRYADNVLHWFLVLTMKMKKIAGLGANPSDISPITLLDLRINQLTYV